MFLTVFLNAGGEGALSCWTREYLCHGVSSLFIQSITLPTLTCLPLTEPRRHHIPDYTQSDGEKTCLDHSCWSWHTRSTAHTCCLQWHNHDAITLMHFQIIQAVGFSHCTWRWLWSQGWWEEATLHTVSVWIILGQTHRDAGVGLHILKPRRFWL